MLAFKGKGVIRIIIKMRLEEIRKKIPHRDGED